MGKRLDWLLLGLIVVLATILIHKSISLAERGISIEHPELVRH